MPLSTLVTVITVSNLHIVHAESAPAYYGRERRLGAVSWANVSMLLGTLLDVQGVDFHIIYLTYPPHALIFASAVYDYRGQARSLRVTPKAKHSRIDPIESPGTAESNLEPSLQQCLTS